MMETYKGKKIFPLFEIYGGKHLSDREIGEDLTNIDLWDTYLHFPGCRMAINRMNRAMFHNGFTYDDLDRTYIIELMKGSIYKDLFGFACIVKDGDFIQSWMPLTDGIGFEMIDYDKKGRAIEIRVTVQPKIGQDPGKQFYIDRAYPEEGITDGFYMLRTELGAPGERGLSLISHLVDRFRNQTEILNKHSKFAQNQAINTPVHKLKGYDFKKDQRTDAQIRALTDDDALIMDTEDDFHYESPPANMGDFTKILDKEDEMIAREGSLNKHMLTGDPEGHLTSSITATANWYAYVKEQQEIMIPKIQSLLVALGSPEDVQFRSPEEWSLEQMANGILLIRKAVEGLVPRQEIIDKINDKFGLKGDQKFTLAPKEEWSNYEGQNNNNKSKIKRFEDNVGTEYEYRSQSTG